VGFILNKRLFWILLIVILLIVILLIANEFILFSFSKTSQNNFDSCLLTPLEELINNSELIVVATAKDSKWVTHKYKSYPEIDLETQKSIGKPKIKNIINTQTTLIVLDIIKGVYSDQEIFVNVAGGCDIRKNYCVNIADNVKLEKGITYLLFFKKPDDNGVYMLNSCDRTFKIELDEQKNIIDKVLVSEALQDENGLVIRKEYTFQDLIDLIK
jgi:hypothetical protein